MAKSKTSKTILIIEDDTILAKMYSERLAREGYNTLLAHDGEEGLKLALDNNIDLVLTDIMLPRVSGTDFIRKIKATKKKSKIPIIAWSNLAGTAEKENVLKLGVREYLIKGQITLDEVAEKVKEHIN